MSLGSTPLGCFPVAGTAAEARAFRSAIGLSPADGANLPLPFLPLTFPMRWLAAPDVRRAMIAMVPDRVALVHEAQTFDYERLLRVGESYALTLLARREVDPDRLVLDGSIAAGDGAPVARLETVLRLFPLDGVEEGTGA